MSGDGPTPEQLEALEVARDLIRAGVPVFAAAPDLDEAGNWRATGGHQGSGYWLPRGWQRTVPTDLVLDGAPFPPWDVAAWRPGYALAAVMGHVLDVVDVDPRNGGEASLAELAEQLPTILGWQSTPSGGWHGFVTPLGVGSRDAVLPGVDVKGGRPDGTGRGSVWIAPTVKLSKSTGEISGYRWGEVVDFTRSTGDTSGTALAERVRALLGTAERVRAGGTGAEVQGATEAYSTAQAEAYIGRALDALQQATEGERERRANAAACTLYHFTPAFLTAEQAVARIEASLPAGWDGPEWRKVVTGVRPPRDGWKAYVDEQALPRGEVWVQGVVERTTVTPGPPPPSGEAEEAFWTSRGVLKHVHAAARARRVSPWAVLGVTLTRVAAVVPPWVVLPAIVGSQASLNVFVGLVGVSGSGKGAATGVAGELLDVGEYATATLGTGEGLLHHYRKWRAPRKDDPGGIDTITDSVLFDCAEVSTLTALGNRQGSTLLPELCKAWSGERLGFGYASAEKRLHLAPHSYRLGLVVGIQPGRAGSLLDDSDAGTPQRFLWLPTVDPGAPDVPPAWPGPEVWLPPKWPIAQWSTQRVELQVCPEAVATIDAAQLAKLRGQQPALDGHAALARLKVSGLLGILDGRPEVNAEDWELAGIVMRRSDATRNYAAQYISDSAERKNEARGRSEGKRAAAASEVLEEAAVRRVERWVAAHLSTEWISSSDIRRRCASRDRQYLAEAIRRHISLGNVEQAETTRPDGARGGGDGILYRLKGGDAQ